LGKGIAPVRIGHPTRV